MVSIIALHAAIGVKLTHQIDTIPSLRLNCFAQPEKKTLLQFSQLRSRNLHAVPRKACLRKCMHNFAGVFY